MNKPGGLWWSCEGCEHLFWLSCSSYGPLVLASVLGGGRLRQAKREGGTLTGRQDGELAGVDGRRRGLGQRHLGASLLAFVFHASLPCFSSEALSRAVRRGGTGWLMHRTSWSNKGRKFKTSNVHPSPSPSCRRRSVWMLTTARRHSGKMSAAAQDLPSAEEHFSTDSLD